MTVPSPPPRLMERVPIGGTRTARMATPYVHGDWGRLEPGCAPRLRMLGRRTQGTG